MPAPSTAELLAQRLGVPREHVVQRKESGADYSEPGATMADAADALRRELSALKLPALRRRALADGVEETALDLASDGADRGC